MSIASGTRVRWAYIKETTRGTTPATPALTTLRTTTRNINLNKNILQSAEQRSDRQIKDLRHGFNRIDGNPGFELSVSAYDDWLEALLGSTFGAINITGTPTLGATSTSTFTRATGSFVTDGIRPGDIIVTTGFSNSGNNGTFTVLTVAALSLTILETTLTTEATGASKTLQLKGKRLDPGTTVATMTVERQFLDVAQFQVFKGVNPTMMSLSVKPEAIVGGSFTCIGLSDVAMSGTTINNGGGAPTAAPTNAPLSSFEGVLVEGGVALGVVTGLELSVSNNRSLAAVVGSRYSPDIFDGNLVVTGRAMVFFQDATLINKFRSETSSSIYLRLEDINGTDFINLVLPGIKYTGGDIDPPNTGPITIEMPFQSLVDNTSGVSMSIQRSNT